MIEVAPLTRRRSDKPRMLDSRPRAHAPFDRAMILKAAASLGLLGSDPNGSPRIMAALCNPQVEAREVAALIGREPALYARVLRVANSPFYGQSRSITTLDRALVVLGLEAVRGIAAAACLDRSFPKNRQHALVDRRDIVRHSLATASAAESLARIRCPALASEAFIAGLLHNLGVVVQMSIDPAGIQAIVALRAAADQREMRTLESEQTFVGHEDCIAAIFETWNLPESLVAAIHGHHDPAAVISAHAPLAALINLGANLGLATGHTFTLETALSPRNPFAMSCLGLDDTELDRVAQELPARVDELNKALFDG